MRWGAGTNPRLSSNACQGMEGNRILGFEGRLRRLSALALESRGRSKGPDYSRFGWGVSEEAIVEELEEIGQ